MRSRNLALESYGAVQVKTGIATANNVQLIQMLFDGLLETLAVAKGHILHGSIEDKSKSLSRAGRIVVGLQSALDMDRGGEISQNLNELYSYVTRRLFHINAYNDLDALEEVQSLMSEIRDAWKTLPGFMGQTTQRLQRMN
jgi:flagellar protein FliS